jgi:hypothetical protein
MKFIINSWNIPNHKRYYSEQKDYFLGSLQDQGFNVLSFWGHLDLEYMEYAKEKFGFEIHSLPPSILDRTFIEKYNLSKTLDGEILNQINLKDGVSWACTEIENIKSIGSLVDEWVITDRPWYWMVLNFSQNRFGINMPFQDEESKKILLENGIEFDSIVNLNTKDTIDDWVQNTQEKFYREYLKRFDPLLEFLNSNNINMSIPIVWHNDIRETCCNKYTLNVVEEYIQKYKPNVYALNATINSPKFFKRLKDKHNIAIYGGTEDIVGLTELKNGRKLLKYGFDGTLSNEHHAMNNRHPLWKDTKTEIEYLKDEWSKKNEK